MLDLIRQILARKPFQPFRITQAAGGQLEIESPHRVALGQTQLTLYHPRSDRFVILHKDQITSVEIVQPA